MPLLHRITEGTIRRGKFLSVPGFGRFFLSSIEQASFHFATVKDAESKWKWRRLQSHCFTEANSFRYRQAGKLVGLGRVGDLL
jgi:hypothetical protein